MLLAISFRTARSSCASGWGAGAGVGDAEMRYAPGNADYGRVRRHLPSLAPGTPPVYGDWD